MESIPGSVCRSCRLRMGNINQMRTFSTTRRRQVIPPESPVFVDIPQTLQPDLFPTKRQKGTLPVPRELFPAQRSDKPSQQYFDNVTKDALPHNTKSPENLTEQGRYKLRMAEARKRHLREGLTELYKRKQDTTAKMTHRSNIRQAERARLIGQAEREDSRLTSVSVPEAMRSTKSQTPIADDLKVAKALHEQKVANYKRTVEAKHEQRLDALHTLYMNARTFITTEEQLNAAIEKEFNPDNFLTHEGMGNSLWAFGPPDTVKKMISDTQGGDKNSILAHMKTIADDATKARYQRDQERMKKIAEKLSGGKI